MDAVGNMKFDIVITWVNGADPVWRSKRAAHSGEIAFGVNVETANVEGRFRDNGELRYLLRSIRRFCAKDVGDIILVTDQQCPACLHELSGVRVVDHRDFISAEYLPTFSSRAIEASLHKIPTLREHFVYFNDDVALMRQVGFSDFFGGAASVFYYTDEPLPIYRDSQMLSGDSDAVNANRFILENYGRSAVRHIGEHSPRGVRKSIMQEIERRHPEVFHEVRAEKFRRLDGQSILANLYPEWCLANGVGEVRRNQCAYVFTDDFERAPKEVSQYILNEVAGRKLSLCVNDTGDNREILAAQQMYAMVMEQVFAENVEGRAWAV